MNYKVYIIEDDFRVANINSQFVNKVDGFEVMGMANSANEALSFLEKTTTFPDLILLDVYIPDVVGLELLWKIRSQYHQIEIIMVTAAMEVETIEETLRGGIFDYIIKPIEFERLEKALLRYKEKQSMFQSKQEMSQEELDKMVGLFGRQPEVENQTQFPKGIDRLTLEKVISFLKKCDESGITAVEMSKHIGASRTTARRYLEYLVATNQVKAELIYGDVGRPERRYVVL